MSPGPSSRSPVGVADLQLLDDHALQQQRRERPGLAERREVERPAAEHLSRNPEPSRLGTVVVGQELTDRRLGVEQADAEGRV